MEPANCKCSEKGRSLVVCIDGTSNQFGEKNTNVVELYSKIEKTDSTQLTYYNSGIGTYAKPSWRSVKYLMQVVDNTIDLAIAWNFESIIIAAYRWLSDNYQENDRIYLFGFSRGAYQIRALAGMIHRVGLIHKGNEEQIPFAYNLYATHTDGLATRFKDTFSRANVQLHFVGVWDTVSSVGIVRGKTLPLTDSAGHICFFRHALALDERRVKFLPEYVHGGVCMKPTTPKNTASESSAQIEDTGLIPSPHIKEVWFPGTHSDIGGGNTLNPDLDLGRTPFLWMSFEAVSCGLRIRPTRVEWRWDHLSDMQESLTWVWRVFEWMPFKRLSYKDESSTVYRLHKGRGRKIKPGQKVHSSVAFCDVGYYPKATLPEQRSLRELVGKGLLSNRDWVKGWEDLIEMDIFDLSIMPDIIKTLKSGTGSEMNMWVYRLTAMTSTDEGLKALRDRPNIIVDFVDIFTNASQPEVRECVTAILEKSSEHHTSVLLSSEHCVWLLRLAREKSEISLRNFAVKLLAQTLPREQHCEDIVDEDVLGVLHEMIDNVQHDWVTGGAFDMFTTILNQNTLSQKLFAANTLTNVRKRLTAENTHSRDIMKRLLRVILKGDENRQHIFDNDVLLNLLAGIEHWNDTVRLLFTWILQNDHEHLENNFFTSLTAELDDKRQDSPSRNNILLILRDTIQHEGLREKIWTSETIRVFHQTFSQVDLLVDPMVLKLYKEIIMCETLTENLRDELLNKNIISGMGNALHNSNDVVRRYIVNFFIAAMDQGGIWDRIFDTELIAILGNVLNNGKGIYVRASAEEIFIAAMAQDGFRDRRFIAELVVLFGRAVSAEGSGVRSGVFAVFNAVTAQDGVWDKILNTEFVALLARAICHESWFVRNSAVQIFTAVITQDGVRDKIFNPDIVAALGRAVSDEDRDARSSAIEFFTAAIAQDDVLENIFDPDIVTALKRAVGDQDFNVRTRAIEFFTAAIAQEGGRNKIFNPDIVATLECAVSDEESNVRSSVIKFFTAAIAQDGFPDKTYDPEIVAVLGRAVSDKAWFARNSAIQIFIAVVTRDGFRDKIFDPDIVAALERAVSDQDSNVRSGAIKLFTAAMAQDGFRGKLLDLDIVTALGRAVGDKDRDVRASAIEFFTAAIAQDGLWDKISNTELIAVLACALCHESWYARHSAIRIFTAVIPQDSVWDEIFTSDNVAALGRAISDQDQDVRFGAIEFFTAAIAQDGFQDKIFDLDIVAALLERVVSDQDYSVRSGAIEFFTTAMVQDQFRERLSDPDSINALRRAVNDQDSNVRSSAIKLFTAAVSQDGLRDKLFDPDIVAVLGRAISDQDSNVRSNAIEFFTVSIAQDAFRDTIFNIELVDVFARTLCHESWYARHSAIRIFIAVVTQDGFRDEIFDPDIVAALGRAISDQDRDIRCGVIEFFTAVMGQDRFRDTIFNAELVGVFSRTLGHQSWFARHSAIKFFTAAITQDGFRDRIFDPDTIAALGRAVSDHDRDVRFCATEFFTAAVAQDGFRDKIFGIVNLTPLIDADLSLEFWTSDYMLPRVYNHFITSALCKQLTSVDSSAREQTRIFISEAIQYDDVHTRICTEEFRKHFDCPRHQLSA